MNSIKVKYNSYLNILNGANSYNAFKDVLYGKNDSLTEYFNHNVLPHLIKNFDSQKIAFSICDIGAGDGKRILSIISYLNCVLNKSSHVDFVEQSTIFCDMFREKLKATSNKHHITIYNSLFENTQILNKFDFIFLIHSIFAFQDFNIFQKINSLLNKKGKIILLSNAEGSFLAKLKLLLDKDYSDSRLEINDIEKMLIEQNISYNKHKFYTQWKIFKDDFQSDINIILEWLSLGEFKNLPQNAKSKIYNEIVNYSDYKEDYYYLKEEENILVIPQMNLSKKHLTLFTADKYNY